MEMEYRDPSKRGKAIVVIGVLLALAAGGAAFYLINQAQQKAGQGTLQKTDVVVAGQPITARKHAGSVARRPGPSPTKKPIEAGDIEVRQVPLDPSNSDAIVFKTPDDVIGRVLAVTVLQDQILT